MVVPGAVPRPQPTHGESTDISPGSGGGTPTAVHTNACTGNPPHLGGWLSQERGGITLGSRAISGPLPLWCSEEMYSPLGTRPCLGSRTSPSAHLTTALGPLLVPGLLLGPAGLRAWFQDNGRWLLSIFLALQPWHQLLGP